MYIKLVVPECRMRGLWAGIGQFFLRQNNEVHYIGGAEILPPPLEGEEENACIQRLRRRQGSS